MFDMRRREFITLLGGARRRGRSRRGRSSPSGCGASACFCRRPRAIRKGGPRRGVPAGAAAIRLDQRPQRADRYALGDGRCRPKFANTRRNWSRSRRTSSWPMAPRPSGRCCRRPAPCRSCFAVIVDPVGAGFVESLARPGGNATGFTAFEYGMSGKWLELLKQIAPSVTRVAVLRDPALASGAGQFGAIQAVAPSLGVEVTPVNVRDAGEIERAVTAFARPGNGGLIVPASAAGDVSSRT